MCSAERYFLFVDTVQLILRVKRAEKVSGKCSTSRKEKYTYALQRSKNGGNEENPGGSVGKRNVKDKPGRQE